MGFFAFFFPMHQSMQPLASTSGTMHLFVCLFVFFFFFWCAKNDEVGFVLSSITFSFLPCTGDFFFTLSFFFSIPFLNFF